MSFASLKRNDLTKLTKALEELSRGQGDSSADDTRLWQPTVDKAGNGYAVIRFLPAPEQDGENGLPWVRKFSHGFQGPGGWYIEECPTTLNKECPVCQYNNGLWKTGIESNKDIVRKQKRKVVYVANIYIVSDSGMPENDKKVKLFKFGKKIFDKINEAMNPQFQDEKPLNPFHLYEGANLKLKVRNVEGYRNYDKSEFDAAGPLLNDDAQLEKIWRSEYSLNEFTSPEQYKPFETLKTKLDKVLGDSVISTSTKSAGEVDRPKAVAPKPVVKKTIEDDFQPTKASAPAEDDDLDYFQKLADAE
jgi:hypothetical protein